MSPTRAEAFERLEPEFGLAVTGPLLDLADEFGRQAAVVLEVGCGAGEATLQSAISHPEVDHLAAEVHTPGLARLLVDIEASSLTNVRVVHGDALEVIDRLPDACLDEIRIWFPDPWPKVRQLQRRIVQPGPVTQLLRCLKSGGRLRLATDVADYAEHMLEVCASIPTLTGGRVPRPADRPVTRFERKGIDAGRPVVDIVMTHS